MQPNTSRREKIGELTGGQRQQDHRHELGEPDPAEIQRAVVELVDLPADRHRGHLRAEAHEDQRDPEQREVAVLKRRPEPPKNTCQAVSCGGGYRREV